MLKVFITNLAKYNEGYCVLDIGKWVELPMDASELQEEIDSVLGNDEELFLTDWESDYKIEIGEFSNVFRLNEQMEELEALPEDTRKTVTLIADYEGLELTEVIEEVADGKYTIYQASNFEELGYYLKDNGLLGYEIPSHLENYIDYEALGRDWLHSGCFIDLSEHGLYVTY